MKKSMKKSVQIALLLCLAGFVIWLVSFIAVGFDITKINTVDHETNEYVIDGAFNQISIRTKTADVRFVLTEEENCKLVCHEEKRVKHTAKVQDGMLIITTKDTRMWYDHIGVSLEDAELILYLPEAQYRTVEIKTDTGAVELPKDFRFEKATVETDTGKIDWKASVSQELVIKSDTGSVWVEADTFCVMKVETSTGDVSVNAETVTHLEADTTTGDITVTSATETALLMLGTDTGEVSLEDIACIDCVVTSDTGKIQLKNVIADVCVNLTSDTGDITFENVDASEVIHIQTDTGDVTGTLLTEKTFFPKTDTGRINVPEITGEAQCWITTNTGDIDIEVVGEK